LTVGFNNFDSEKASARRFYRLGDAIHYTAIALRTGMGEISAVSFLFVFMRSYFDPQQAQH